MRHDPPSYAGRLARLRSEFPETGNLLVLNAHSIRYLTGFTGGDGALMVGGDGPVLLVDGRYATQARDEAQGTEIFEFKNRIDGIVAVALRSGAGAVGFESPELSVEEYLKLQEKLPGVELRPLSGGFLLLRAVKDEGEVAWIREAARIAGEALASVREMIRPGVRESEIAVELEYRMRRGGAEKAAFETIVASGPHSALPHATPGSRAVRDGDCVVVDCGAVCNGYHSDETCTYIVGRASERQKEVYAAVREAHDRAIAAVRAGVSCGEIDRIAREVLVEAGLGDFFSHGTGHGVGLDVHEGPRLAPGREELLRAGMVVTVEPGVYIPDLWGIRIEDTVWVAEEGCEILTQTPKELTLL
jgi:Xaa-Pro aminopeptidase/Xaa-Pro dipeptidase